MKKEIPKEKGYKANIGFETKSGHGSARYLPFYKLMVHIEPKIAYSTPQISRS